MKQLVVTSLALLGCCAVCAAAPAATPGYACLIEPSQRVELRSAVEARIDASHVDRGAEVRRGQVLVDLDSAAERTALDGAKYRAVMEGQLKRSEERLT